MAAASSLAIARGFMEAIGGTITAANRTALAAQVHTLRRKLEADPEQLRLILAEQGVGYRLRAADQG